MEDLFFITFLKLLPVWYCTFKLACYLIFSKARNKLMLPDKMQLCYRNVRLSTWNMVKLLFIFFVTSKGGIKPSGLHIVTTNTDHYI